MTLQPIPKEQIEQTAQILVTFLSDENVSIPAPMLEGIVSAKSLMRGILSGALVICQPVAAAPAPVKVDADVKSNDADEESEAA